jgi:hypothetical protein
MTDLDTFRRALQGHDLPGPGPGAPRPGTLDIGEIMARGRWLRRRRRLAAGAAGLAAVITVVIGAGHLSHAGLPSTALARPPATSARSSGPPATPGPAGSSPPRREGRVIPAMFKEAGGELVFYGVRIRLAELPGTTFGIMAGLRDTAGRLTPEVEANETAGPDTATGFHAVQAATSVGSPAAAIPEFGYYAGPATAITARDAGRLVHAHLARWSVNPRIVVFWFTPPAAPASATLTGLAAYNHAGHRLPAGNPAPGRG